MRAAARRVDAGMEQRLGRVDVADADHHLAIHQQRLDRNPAMTCLFVQVGAVECRGQRLRSEVAQPRVVVRVLVRPQHGTESTRVMQSQALPAEHQVDMIMRTRRRRGGQHPQAAGHAEMDQQCAVGEAQQQVLGSALDRLDTSPASSVARLGTGQRS